MLGSVYIVCSLTRKHQLHSCSEIPNTEGLDNLRPVRLLLRPTCKCGFDELILEKCIKKSIHYH